MADSPWDIGLEYEPTEGQAIAQVTVPSLGNYKLRISFLSATSVANSLSVWKGSTHYMDLQDIVAFLDEEFVTLSLLTNQVVSVRANYDFPPGTYARVSISAEKVNTLL